ncbi:MAG: CDP-alcohol phosphatidyltransferase family protein [Candidatus Marinimicrobia bacterium]|nr:CDP-alcohol phosphatidyltransferase family protein [Candidatus Neomarinimicrobiota bacterium]
MQFNTQVKENYRQAIEVSNVSDFWTNQVCRRIAAFIVIIINPTPITPNIVTIISFAMNMAANFQLLNDQLALAAILYFLAYVLDCADGQLARLRDVVSYFGRFFDPVLDGLKDLITFLVLIAYFSETNLFYFSLIGMFNVSASITFDWVRHTIQNRPKDVKKAPKNNLQKLGIVFWSVPTRNFIIVFSFIMQYPAAIVYYVCFPGTYFTIRKAWSLVVILREK